MFLFGKSSKKLRSMYGKRAGWQKWQVLLETEVRTESAFRRFPLTSMWSRMILLRLRLRQIERLRPRNGRVVSRRHSQQWRLTHWIPILLLTLDRGLRLFPRTWLERMALRLLNQTCLVREDCICGLLNPENLIVTVDSQINSSEPYQNTTDMMRLIWRSLHPAGSY